MFLEVLSKGPLSGHGAHMKASRGYTAGPLSYTDSSKHHVQMGSNIYIRGHGCKSTLSSSGPCHKTFTVALNFLAFWVWLKPGSNSISHLLRISFLPGRARNQLTAS